MLCNAFKTLSRATWENISLSQKASFQLKEESLTDFNMLHLKLLGSPDIDVVTFNKREEGKNGADWEWWFNDGRRWMGFRVQAKVISNTSDEFEHLHYKAPTKAPQSEILILQSEKAAVPVIPLYCLYMATISLDPAKLLAAQVLYGCSLMSAYKVLAFRSSKTCDVRSLQPYMTPWHQLVCSAAPSFDGIIEIARGFLPKEEGSELAIQTLVREQPPAYVRFAGQRNIEYQISEAELPDLDGVLVINLPETNTER